LPEILGLYKTAIAPTTPTTPITAAGAAVLIAAFPLLLLLVGVGVPKIFASTLSSAEN
jgi:hypothetical protein